MLDIMHVNEQDWNTVAAINPIELQKALKGVSYPAEKSDLVKAAEENGAAEEIRSEVEKLSGQTFETPAEVTEATDFRSGAPVTSWLQH